MSENINQEELKAAETAAEETTEGVYVHILSRPVTLLVGSEQKTVDRLNFDFDKLTGRDSLAVEREMQSLGIPLMVKEFSGDYQLRVAARACSEKIGSDVLAELPMKDYNRILGRTRSFLLK